MRRLDHTGSKHAAAAKCESFEVLPCKGASPTAGGIGASRGREEAVKRRLGREALAAVNEREVDPLVQSAADAGQRTASLPQDVQQ